MNQMRFCKQENVVNPSLHASYDGVVFLVQNASTGICARINPRDSVYAPHNKIHFKIWHSCMPFQLEAAYSLFCHS